MEILTKESLVRAKTAPTAISRTFTPLLRETRFPLEGFTSPAQNQRSGGGKLSLKFMPISFFRRASRF